MTFNATEYWVDRQRESDHSGNSQYTPQQQNLHNDFKRAILLAVLAEHPEIRTVADLGAGSGCITSDLPFDVDVDYLDVSPDAVERMRKAKLRARVGTADDLADVDLVVAYDVLYHIVDDDEFAAALGSIRRHAQLLLVSDGFDCLDCERKGHGTPHCRHRSLRRYSAVELRSWNFPSKLPKIHGNRIKLLSWALRNDDSLVFYDEFYESGGWRYKIERERAALRSVVDAAKWQPGQRILEVGCGMGMHAKIFADMGLLVTAIDASHNGIIKARERYGSSEQLTYVAADLAKWEPTKRQLDGIYVRGMSYFHYELDGINRRGIDVPAQTERLFSWLRPGGIFVLQISTDLSGDRWKDNVHSNRYRDYVDLFERFGKILSFKTLEGAPVDETTRGDPSRGPTNQGISVMVQREVEGA